jgi:spore maturation protein SpmB
MNRPAAAFVTGIFREAWEISYRLFRIMIPVILAVKVLRELGTVELLGKALSPVMELTGLPGSMGLVWATTMLTNLYGGVIVFFQLVPAQPLTVAQTTVLATMMLVAHNLPIELRIAQKAGVRLFFMGALRIGGGFVFGLVLFKIYALGGWLQEGGSIVWAPPAADPSLGAWVFGQIEALGLVFLIILGLLFVMRILERVGITKVMTRCLSPVLRLLGIGEGAVTITIVGMTLGIAYGGGLIIQEAMSGRVEKKDVLFSLTLMGLCHSLFEDTMVMALMGGSLSGILWGRMVFSLAAVFFFVKWVSRCSQASFNRYFVNNGPS